MPPSPQPAKQAAARAYNLFNLVAFVIGAKAVTTINVGVTLKGARGEALQAPAHCEFYLSDNADGSTLTATAATSALAIGTDGVLELVTVTGKAGKVISKANGKFDINVIQSASPVTYYFVVKMPDGSISVSAAVTF